MSESHCKFRVAIWLVYTAKFVSFLFPWDAYDSTSLVVEVLAD